jgi:hypothetical protein
MGRETWTQADYLAKLHAECRTIRRTIAKLALNEADLAAVTRATERAYRAERFSPPGSCDLISDARSGLEAALDAGREVRRLEHWRAIRAIRDEMNEERARSPWAIMSH